MSSVVAFTILVFLCPTIFAFYGFFTLVQLLVLATRALLMTVWGPKKSSPGQFHIFGVQCGVLAAPRKIHFFRHTFAETSKILGENKKKKHFAIAAFDRRPP